MRRDGDRELCSGAHGGASATLQRDSDRSSFAERGGILAMLRATVRRNFLLMLGAVAFDHWRMGDLGGGARCPALGSFADEIGGGDADSLKESRCIFCTANLYLTLPLVALLAFLLIRLAAKNTSLTENLWETIGALWLTGYLFAFAGAMVAHELTHRNSKFATLSA